MIQYSLFSKYYTPTNGFEIDLSNYYTKSEVDNLIQNAIGTIDLDEYYKKGETYSNIEVDNLLQSKQDELISGTNIKTINNQSILGNGNIDISSGEIPYYGMWLSHWTLTTTEFYEPKLIEYVNIGPNPPSDENKYGVYKLYYYITSLPSSATAQEYIIDTLSNYEIHTFLNIYGFTTNGYKLSNGRTDNTTNNIIIQQASKNRKSVMLRCYSNQSNEGAYLVIEFIGKEMN